ncbi:MAG: hypothetical protein KJT03_00670 [Verrucomicrobiae bacterium]|nr:hypothetical protein [Verrucomicrobiae bacterium]
MKLPKNLSIAFASILLVFAGCSDEPSVQKYRVSKTPLPAATTAGTSVQPGGGSDQGLPFTWVVPEGWEAGKSSSMRLASYNVPLSTGETGDFSLVQLSGAAGGVMANINRWRGQIGLEPVEVEGLGSSAHMHDTGQGQQYLHVTLINENNPESAILGAIFQQPDFVLFAKLTASRAGAEEAQESFEAFCNSVTFK